MIGLDVLFIGLLVKRKPPKELTNAADNTNLHGSKPISAAPNRRAGFSETLAFRGIGRATPSRLTR